jgi:DNA-binding MarR family transcriptional regulator
MTPDYEIVYSAAMERARTEAIRQSADYSQLQEENPRSTVLDCLMRHPLSTVGELAARTGLPVPVVNSAIYRLRELRYVKRSHAQNENRQQPVRYWAA